MFVKVYFDNYYLDLCNYLNKMNPIFIKTILNIVQNERQKQLGKPAEVSSYHIARAYLRFLIAIKRGLKDLILISIAVLLAAFGFKGFLLTNRFIDGGATGIALLLSIVTNIPLHIFIVFVNIPFIIIAYYVMGKRFAIKAVFSISLLSIVLAYVHFPNVTDDNLLVSVFGGFFLGAGVGFAIRGGTVIDGTEILAIFLSKKTGSTIGDIIIVINVIIFSIAAYVLGIDRALYSMITYLSASKTLDFIVEGLDEYIGVTIVSNYPEKIKEMIKEKLDKSVIMFKGKRGFHKNDIAVHEIDIVYTVITRLEINKLNTEIEKIDPNAFVIMNMIRDIKGGVNNKKRYFINTVK